MLEGRIEKQNKIHPPDSDRNRPNTSDFPGKMAVRTLPKDPPDEPLTGLIPSLVGKRPKLVDFLPICIYQRDPEVFFGPSVFLEAWGTKAKKP